MHLSGIAVILHLAMLRCVKFFAAPIESGRAVILGQFVHVNFTSDGRPVPNWSGKPVSSVFARIRKSLGGGEGGGEGEGEGEG